MDMKLRFLFPEAILSLVLFFLCYRVYHDSAHRVINDSFHHSRALKLVSLPVQYYHQLGFGRWHRLEHFIFIIIDSGKIADSAVPCESPSHCETFTWHSAVDRWTLTAYAIFQTSILQEHKWGKGFACRCNHCSISRLWFHFKYLSFRIPPYSVFLSRYRSKKDTLSCLLCLDCWDLPPIWSNILRTLFFSSLSIRHKAVLHRFLLLQNFICSFTWLIEKVALPYIDVMQVWSKKYPSLFQSTHLSVPWLFFVIKYFYVPLVVGKEIETLFPFIAISAEIHLYRPVLNLLLYNWGTSVDFTLLSLMTNFVSF